MKTTLLFYCFILLSYGTGLAQNYNGIDTATAYRSVNTASNKLLKSIKENKPGEEIAANYFNLAKELAATGDHSKAEFYINKAIQLESGSKTKKNLAEYYRELGRVQELQDKNTLAAASYKKAADLSIDSIQKQLNWNDASRLQNKSSPQYQLEYLNQNAIILSATDNNPEKLRNYKQMASNNIALNQNEPAIENLSKALNTVDSNSESSVLLKNDIANLMMANNNYGDAVAIQKDAVAESWNISSVPTQVTQLRNLSAIYFKIDSVDAGLRALTDAYNLALEKGSLKEARESLASLTEFYKANKQEEKATKLYSDFVAQLDNLLARDSSLIDKRLFLVTEGKIAELEQQQLLKDELIQRKNKFTFVLIGSVVLLSTLLLLIVKAWFSIRKRNKQIALQSLRREMNPHFIFNSLNSVNQFIANNNEREANKYLSSYSNLMRNIMENSNKDYVTLGNEIDQLKKYLELEKLRFSDKFEYRIEIDPTLNTDTVMVPNMLIQPNLENAIWHGLRYKESKGFLKLEFRREGNKTVALVDDNGIGLTESKKIKTKNQKLHESLGLKNVRERIGLLNDIYKKDIRFELTEKPEGGALVKIEW
jgi:tetratricopeptide (TPR) repeat protein